MRIYCLFLWVYFLLPMPGQADENNTFLGWQNFRYIEGDLPISATPTLSSHEWNEFDSQLRRRDYKGLFTILLDIQLQGDSPPTQDWELNLHMLAAQEVYFDNQFVGVNGLPAKRKLDEIPGHVWFTYLVPNHLLTPGTHTVAIKASAHYRETGMKLLREIHLRPFHPNYRYVSFWSLIPTLLVSVCALIGLYFLMLFFTEGKHWEHLIFCMLLESLTLYGFAIQWDHLVGYTYDWEVVNLTIEVLSTLSIVILLPSYFLLRHKVARPWLWLLTTAVIIKLIQALQLLADGTVLWGASFLLALFINIYFGRRARQHFWWESLGLGICLVAVLSQSLENVFLYFPLFFAFVLLTHAITMQKRKLALKDALLLESQLRADLLRKHIQPHFLLNTLTSLMEWSETDTEKSSLFISELADEFRLMSKVSSNQLCSLSTEVELCRKHLSLMSLRLQKVCQLLVNGLVGDEPFPPAIFHTLIENAFSHNVFEQHDVIFRLEKSEMSSGNTLFILTSPCNINRHSNFRKIGTGTGKKYIEARLNQCFGKHWYFTEGRQKDCWITTIEVNYKKLVKQKVSNNHEYSDS